MEHKQSQISYGNKQQAPTDKLQAKYQLNQQLKVQINLYQPINSNKTHNKPLAALVKNHRSMVQLPKQDKPKSSDNKLIKVNLWEQSTN